MGRLDSAASYLHEILDANLVVIGPWPAGLYNYVGIATAFEPGGWRSRLWSRQSASRPWLRVLLSVAKIGAVLEAVAQQKPRLNRLSGRAGGKRGVVARTVRRRCVVLRSALARRYWRETGADSSGQGVARSPARARTNARGTVYLAPLRNRGMAADLAYTR